jgi:hypothetical protein
MNIRRAKILAAALPALTCIWLGYAPAANAEWVPCAGENGYCATPFPTIVRYGAHGSYARRRSWRGGIPCNNGVFGDPIFGVLKHCDFWAD